MIGCEISGGLGNQFFRYAFVRNLQEKRQGGEEDELMINFAATDKHGVSGDLSDFNIKTYKHCKCRRVLLKYGYFWQILLYVILTRLERVFRNHGYLKLKYKFLGYIGIVISENPDDETLYYPSNNIEKIFAIGNFENSAYFADVRKEVLKELTPIHGELHYNNKLYDVIRNENSVCLAIRRGDFMTDENRKVFYVCDMSYFQSGVKYMQDNIENPVFIVFSNDIEYVKQNLKINGRVYYESGNDPVWETFRLMYSCKHFIISNSTLHWWAQYKSDYKDKIVVAPERWYNAPGWENHLMEDYFVKLPTGVRNPFEE